MSSRSLSSRLFKQSVTPKFHKFDYIAFNTEPQFLEQQHTSYLKTLLRCAAKDIFHLRQNLNQFKAVQIRNFYAFEFVATSALSSRLPIRLATVAKVDGGSQIFTK